MKTLSRTFILSTVLAVVALVGLWHSPLGAQSALSSTTLAAAVTSEGDTTITVASSSGITANNIMLLIDRELITVVRVSGTSLTVSRGANGTRSTTHANGATVYYASPTVYTNYYRSGSCTGTAEAVLPIPWPQGNMLYDCSSSVWTSASLTPVYLWTVLGKTGAAGTSPATGGQGLVATGGTGGAQSATTGSGGIGGAPAVTGGTGGAGGSSSGTGGAGGQVSSLGGVGGGTITGGAGGAAVIGGGAGGAGSSAGGTGGAISFYSGAAGSGGTGTSGAIAIKFGGAAGTSVFAVAAATGKTTVSSAGTNQDILVAPSGTGNVTVSDGTDITKTLTFELSGGTTAVATTFSLSPSTARTVTFPNASITVPGTVVTDCMAGGATCTPSTVSSTSKVIYGTSGVLNGASPSVAAVTLSPAFTASTSYICTATGNGTTAAIAAAGVSIAYTSASVVTFTSLNGGTHAISYVCWGT